MHSWQQLADCAETLIILPLLPPYRREDRTKDRSHSFNCSLGFLLSPTFLPRFVPISIVDLVFDIDRKSIILGGGARITSTCRFRNVVRKRSNFRYFLRFIFWENRTNNWSNLSITITRSNVYFLFIFFLFYFKGIALKNTFEDDYIKNSFFSQPLFSVQLHF